MGQDALFADDTACEQMGFKALRIEPCHSLLWPGKGQLMLQITVTYMLDIFECIAHKRVHIEKCAKNVAESKQDTTLVTMQN